MKRFVAIFLFTCACTITHAQVNFITTICGNGVAGYNGDGILAINAELNYLEGICYDHHGNIYIADDANSRIRKIDLSTGIITTFAGTDSAGYSGDGGPATNAKLFVPADVYADSSGNIYIADGLNNRIRKVNISTGIITTVAGNGTAGGSGDGGLATNAELFQPCGICLDKFGNLFIADLSNFKVRKVDALTGIITTVAGTGLQGYTGDNGPAINAELASPTQVYADSSANVLIVDDYNNVIREINSLTGVITTVIGNGTIGYSGDGGSAVHASLNQPYGIYIDSRNNIFIADVGNGAVRKIDGITGIITTVAGDGTPGYSGDGGLATDAKMTPEGMCIDDNGIMYIADYENNRVRMIYNPLSIKTLSPSKEILLYPNPAHDALTIENAKGNEVLIIDIFGQEIFRGVLSSNSGSIDISGFANGVYMIQLCDPALMKTVTKKVVKE